MRPLFALLAVSLLPISTFASTKPTPSGSTWSFDLLPRSLQNNPLVDVHVITEMTAAGRARPIPTATKPTYYVTSPAGIVALGLGATKDEKPPDVDQLEKHLRSALTVSHFHPAKDGQSPDIAIIYSWGSHSSPINENDPGVSDEGVTDLGESRDALIRDTIERAKLVGGEKFAAALIKALHEESASRRATPPAALDQLASPMGPISFEMFSPLEQFRSRNPNNAGLLYDSGGSIHFVIASAYDAKSLSGNRRVLLWRTKMSTRASGISLLESVPSLIATAAPFFGQDMIEPESARRRLSREGSVKIAPLKLLNYEPSAPANPTPPSTPPGEGSTSSPKTER